MATVESLLIKIGLKADTLPLTQLQAGLDSVNSKLRMLVGIEAFKGFVHLTEGAGHAALELENAAVASGMTTDALQALQYAVTQTGGNAGELGMTMTHLARMIEGAKLGADDALMTFYKLGISQQQIASFHNTEDALYGVMDALRKIKDPLKQKALLDQALGQGSRGLARFALAGSAAAKASTSAARTLGALVPKKTLDNVAKAQASMMTLGLIFRAVTSSIAGAFAPSLTQAIEGVERFYSANKELISSTLTEWIDRACFGFGVMYAAVYTVFTLLADFIRRHKVLVSTLMEVAPALLAIGIAMPRVLGAFSALRSVLGVVVSLWAAFSVEALGAAVAMGAVVTAFTLIGAAVTSCFQVLNGKKWEDTAIFKLAGVLSSAGGFAKAVAGLAGGKLGEILHEFDAPGIGTTLDGPPSPMMGSGTAMLLKAAGVAGNAAQFSAQNSIAPAMLSTPLGAMAGSQSYAPTITNNVNVTVPPGTTPAQARAMVTSAVDQSMANEKSNAMRRFQSPYLL